MAQEQRQPAWAKGGIWDGAPEPFVARGGLYQPAAKCASWLAWPPFCHLCRVWHDLPPTRQEAIACCRRCWAGASAPSEAWCITRETGSFRSRRGHGSGHGAGSALSEPVHLEPEPAPLGQLYHLDEGSWSVRANLWSERLTWWRGFVACWSAIATRGSAAGSRSLTFDDGPPGGIIR